VEKYRYLQNVVVRVHKSTRQYLFTNKLDYPTLWAGGGDKNRFVSLLNILNKNFRM
jgi:hypothetical protein